MYPFEFILVFVLAYAIVVALGTIKLLHLLLYPQRVTYGTALGKDWPTQPKELKLNAIEHLYQLADGTQTPAWEIQGQKPDGPIIIITHGWSSGRYISLMKAPLFTPYAAKIMIYDLRAHGDHTAKRSLLGTQETDDLLELIQKLDTGQKRFILVGTSMGAGISIAAASRDFQAGHNRILGVFADGPYNDPLEPIKGQMRFRKMPVFPMVHLAYYHFKFWHNNLKDFHRAAHAKQIPVPLFVVHGDQDPICPLDEAKLIVNAAPKGHLTLFPGGKHGGLASLDLPLYQKTLASFFQSTQKEQPHDQ